MLAAFPTFSFNRALSVGRSERNPVPFASLCDLPRLSWSNGRRRTTARHRTTAGGPSLGPTAPLSAASCATPTRYGRRCWRNLLYLWRQGVCRGGRAGWRFGPPRLPRNRTGMTSTVGCSTACDAARHPRHPLCFLTPLPSFNLLPGRGQDRTAKLDKEAMNTDRMRELKEMQPRVVRLKRVKLRRDGARQSWGSGHSWSTSCGGSSTYTSSTDRSCNLIFLPMKRSRRRHYFNWCVGAGPRHLIAVE